jgi:hypothetical protein
MCRLSVSRVAFQGLSARDRRVPSAKLKLQSRNFKHDQTIDDIDSRKLASHEVNSRDNLRINLIVDASDTLDSFSVRSRRARNRAAHPVRSNSCLEPARITPSAFTTINLSNNMRKRGMLQHRRSMHNRRNVLFSWPSSVFRRRMLSRRIILRDREWSTNLQVVYRLRSPARDVWGCVL